MKKKKLRKKSLCKLDKDDIANHFDEIILLLRQPEFICTKCARSSSTENMLCKPREM